MNWVFLFDIEGLKEKIAKLELETYEEDFWQDIDKAQKTMQELKGLNKKVEEYENLKKSIEDLKVLIELAVEEEDYQVYKEIETYYNSISKEVETFKLSILLNGPYDKNNAILSIHSGAGGLEAQDWAEMLFRMYKRWADRKGFK